MKVHPLDVVTQAATGATHLLEIDYTDLTTAGAAQTLSPINVANKMGFALVFAKLLEAFVSSDATLLSTTITVGDGGSATRFLLSQELNTAAPIWLKGGVTTVPQTFVYTVDDTVDVFFACTAGKLLTTHTAGRLGLYCKVIDARN